ncbi:hypothetical protein A0H81_08441 [Grifola frondosa]|uniref:Uncharacterized protein n=1 Tax=Grifola frondosa TaxID=5627 RepID=A0A1C7M3N7_GRIFR|nr:hypothetical protein A0H81_08441 [Grifola frondosa]
MAQLDAYPQIVGFLVLYYLPLKANTILAVPPGKAKKILSEGLTALVQSVALTYFAVLVLLTQQLATRRMLHMRQSLTTIHDKAAAWSGMGSAVTAVFRQIFVPSQSSSTAKSGFIVDVGVVVIALYLGCIHILHITTPSAFAVQDLPARHTKNQSYVQRLLEENEPVKLPLGRTQASLFLPFEDAIKILPILTH